MIMQRLSSECLLDGKLLGNLTRRRAAHILIAFLANFFTISVPLMLSLPRDLRADLSSDIILARQLNTVGAEPGLLLYPRHLFRRCHHVLHDAAAQCVFLARSARKA